MAEIKVRTSCRSEMVDISVRAAALIPTGFKDGLCNLFCLHTTCGLTVNENADPAVQSDILGYLASAVPPDAGFFTHAEGNSDAHVKTLLAGPSLTIPVRDGAFLLGRWQGIYLCEFDGPRERAVVVTFTAAAS